MLGDAVYEGGSLCADAENDVASPAAATSDTATAKSVFGFIFISC
jgi:hypothetical protein